MRPYHLVDASIYIFRAYFSLPEGWPSPQGYSQNAVYGFTSFLLDLLAETAPEGGVSLACCFDESLGSCYRNAIYPAYKSSRELPDEGLAYQLRACREISECLGIACFSGPEFEADDYLATLACLVRQSEQPVCLVTRDKDLGQLLVRPEDCLWDYAAGNRMYRDGFIEKFGVLPEQFADYLGLVGDPIDDIPGVPSVGAKTATRLLQAYADLEQLSYNIEAISRLGIRGTVRIQKSLREHWSDALMSRQLARLAHTIPNISLPPDYALSRPRLESLLDYLERIQLHGGLQRRCQKLLQRV